jgi:AraC-like DNA-binding protein
MLNLNIAVLCFGIFQSGLLAMALLKRKQQHPANIYLIFFLLVVGLQLMFKLLSKAWLWEHVRTIYMISYNYGYLIGPLVFLFFRSQREEKLFKKSDLLHFLPFGCSTMLTIADEVFGLIYHFPFKWMLPWPSLQIVSVLCYGAAAWKLKGNNKESIRQFLVLVFATESVILLAIVYLVQNIGTAPNLRLIFTSLTGLIFWITYKLIATPNAFYHFRPVPVVKLLASPIVRYANSGLRQEDANSILAALKVAIEKDQLFLQHDVTLDRVAKILSVKKHHLSQVINQEFGHSFTELMYNWRLEEARQRLADPRHSDQKISAIAFDLGFSSLPVFTTKFKKRFGMTPSEYRNEGGGDSQQCTSGA